MPQNSHGGIRVRVLRALTGGTAKLAGGAAVSQAIGLAAYPFITRLYEPSSLGVLSVYMSTVGIVGVVASFRYDQAIPLPFASRDAVSLSVLSLWLSTAISVLSGLVILLAPELNPAAHTEQELLIAVLVPIGIFVTSLYTTMNMFALRLKKFAAIGRTRLMQGIVGTALQLAGGVMGIGSVMLVSGQVVGQSAGITSLFRGCRDHLQWESLKRSVKRVPTVAHRYRKFVIFGTPSALLNTAGLLLGAVFVSSNFGLSAAGFFGIATTVLTAPVQLVGKSSAQVFFTGSASIIRKSRSLVRLQLATLSIRLVFLGVAPAALIVLFGSEIFEFVFGGGWRTSGEIAALLVLPYLLAVVSAPAAQVFLLVERQELSLGLNVLKVLAPLIGLLIVPRLGFGLLPSVAIYAVILGVYYAAVLIVAFKVLRSVER